MFGGLECQEINPETKETINMCEKCDEAWEAYEKATTSALKAYIKTESAYLKALKRRL